MASRKKKQEQLKNLERRRKARARRNLQVHEGYPGYPSMPTPDGALKMSEVLGDFVAPLLMEADTEESIRTAVQMGAIAWNLALFPEPVRSQKLADMVSRVPAEGRRYLRETLEELVRRKDEHFAQIKRTVIDFSITMQSSGPYIQVVSSLVPEKLSL